MEEQLRFEDRHLHPRAARSREARRERPEEDCVLRNPYQRDRDRILHAKAFRRLKHKTQVFIAPEGDHFRTRLTHTLEVAQIARTLARALRLHEDLTEAIALGHDLGHTPFGHSGERVLDELSPGGFRHYRQSLRVVESLEREGRGLNLTEKVRQGILAHSKGEGPILGGRQSCGSLEGELVRLSDIIAYVNHDLDDAHRAGIVTGSDIPGPIRRVLGDHFAQRLDRIVQDVVSASLANGLTCIACSPDILEALDGLRGFLFERVYHGPHLSEERGKVGHVLRTLYTWLTGPGQGMLPSWPDGADVQVRAVDFIAGMTDNYAISLFCDVTMPVLPQKRGGTGGLGIMEVNR